MCSAITGSFAAIQIRTNRDSAGKNDAEKMRNDMTKSDQLERDAERIRAHLSETAIELRARLTPAHAIDQLFDLRSDSAALGILRNFRDKMVANPLAVGIVGAGMAWLMYSRGREARHSLNIHQQFLYVRLVAHWQPSKSLPGHYTESKCIA
jgi:hypothetical protein